MAVISVTNEWSDTIRTTGATLISVASGHEVSVRMGNEIAKIRSGFASVFPGNMSIQFRAVDTEAIVEVMIDEFTREKSRFSTAILGSFEQVDNLPLDPLPEIGDAYIAGTHLWFFDGNEFIDGGDIRGIAGPVGPRGERGPSGPQGERGMLTPDQEVLLNEINSKSFVSESNEVAGGITAPTDDPEVFARTWLEYSPKGGGMTEWAKSHVRRDLGIPRNGIPEAATFVKATDTSKIVGWGASDMIDLVPHLTTMAQDFQATFVNKGWSNTWMHNQWLGHGSNVVSAHFPEYVIPAHTNEIQLWIDGWTTGGNQREYAVMVEGRNDIFGTLRGDIWKRNIIEGVSEDIQLEGNVRLIATANRQYLDCVQIWMNGLGDLLNGNHATVKTYMSLIEQAYNSHPTMDKKVLAIGHWVPHNANATTTGRVTEANDLLREMFKERFVDQRAYLASPQFWDHVGITPTQNDLDMQAIQKLGPSQRRNNTHLTPEAAQAVVNHLIRPHLLALGWY